MTATVSEPIDAMTAAALGALQGLTEFLPVSSSGHIAIAAKWLGMREAPLELSVILHVGTLVATLWLFRADVLSLFRECARSLTSPRRLTSEPEGRLVAGLLIATVVTGIVGLSLKDTVEAWSEVPRYIGLMLWLTAIALLATKRLQGTNTELSWTGVVVVGLMQGIAVMPGLSRSGLTIAAAMGLRMRSQDAFRFSFLLSLPAITGAALLELADAEAIEALGPSVWVGGLVALVTGYIALRMLRRVVFQGKLWMFAAYLIPAGALLVFGAP